MPNLGQNPASTGYFSQHRDQLRINPVMITGFMFLNVRTPPFNDVRVRQAVNLALDRGLVVNHYGGPVAARPTCQIMPPALAGYRRYCPYTRDPAADGAWHGPDLARARKLVAASGTAGMTGHCLGHRHAPGHRQRDPRRRGDAPPARLPGLAAAAAGKHLLRLHPRLTQPCSGHRRRLERRLPLRRHLHRQARLQLLRSRQRAGHQRRQRVLRPRPWTGRSPGPPPCRPPTRPPRRPGGRSSTASSPTGRSSCPPSPRTRSTSCPAARATSSTTRSGERSSTSSGSA